MGMPSFPSIRIEDYLPFQIDLAARCQCPEIGPADGLGRNAYCEGVRCMRGKEGGENFVDRWFPYWHKKGKK